MASNNKLYRNFVILQEDERGYANSSDKTLSGYSKIEAKGDRCKISFYAQNLRKDNDNYCMMLICSKKDMKQIVNLGTIPISESGKGEITKEYNVSSIGGLDLSFDKISGTAIAKMTEEIPVFVMCGFLNGEQPSDNWKNYKVIKTNESKSKYAEKVTEKECKKENKKESKVIDKKKDEKECDREEIKEKSIENNIEEKSENEHIVRENDAKEVIEKNKGIDTENIDREIQDNGENEKVPPYIPKENLRGKFEDYEDQIEEYKEFDPNINKIRGSIGEYFESIVYGFERDNKKFDEIKYTKWYNIPVHDLHEMCNMSNYNKYTLAYYPMLNYYPYIKKYGYFMLGYKCDSKGELKHIIYAIPGKKDKDEQPYDGRTGFVTWLEEKDNPGMGCWIMFYDFKNSTVVVPMQ